MGSAVANHLPPKVEDRPEFPAGKAILATMLKYPASIAPVMELLEVEDWSWGWGRDLFEAFRELFDQGLGVDPAAVTNELFRRGRIGPGSYGLIGDLLETYTNEHTVLQHCHSFKEHSIRRRLENAGHEILRTSPEAPLQQAICEAERLIADVAQLGAETHVVSMAVAVGEAWDRIDAAGLRSRGLATGFHDADEITGGLQASELVIIAARPSVGKTALAINLAL
jgi:replicative DNA helicase